MRPPPLRLSLLIWGLAAAFYLYGFFQRVAPASLALDLMRDFGLTAAALGNLSAFYYYCYAGMQLPTGVLVDRYGPSRLFFAGAIVGGLGALLFAAAPNAAVASVGRGLIGGAHAVAWISMLKLITHWFPAHRFGFMSGLSLAIGTIGAVLSGPPLRALADELGWRPIIAGAGIGALLLAIAIRRWMRDDPASAGGQSFAPDSARPGSRPAPVLQGLLEVWRYRNTGLLFVANSGVCGAFLTFAGLWGVPFLTQHHGLGVQRASLITSLMLVLFALGGTVAGTVSDRLRRRKLPYFFCAAALALGFCVLAAAPDAPLKTLVPPLLAGAFGAGGGTAISFGFAKESVPARLQGTVTGAANLGVMSGTLIQMPLIGLILDQLWRGTTANGVRVYDLAAYQTALSLLAGWVVLSTILLAFTRETYARQPG
jgi:sugar phosphate permease